MFENALDDSAAVGVSGEGKDLRRTGCTPCKRWPGAEATGTFSDHSKEACHSQHRTMI